MRKHHSWWVALLGAGALAACGTAVPAAAADDREPAWPKVERGESDYSLDGFTVGPLPEGLERHSVEAASSSDRDGNRRSEITWVQGSDDRAGHVAVLRSDRIQDLEDLRQERFGHLRSDGLERLGENEGFGEGAYVSEDTGHLFWVERPGVGVATHLDPDKWDRGDLVELAGSVTGIEDEDSAESAEEGEPAEETGSSDAAEAGDAPEEADAEEGADEVPGAGSGTEGQEAAEDDADGASVAENGTEASATDGAAERPGTGSGEAAESVTFPASSGEQGVSAFHRCAVERFDESTGPNADHEGVTEETRAFVERTLDTDALTGGERDRFLATAWFHASEADKLSAAEECAEDQQADGGRTQDATTGASGVVAELDAQARTVFEQARYGDGTADADTGTEEAALGTIGAQEWERVQERLPYSLPSGGS
ncbi:ICP22 family protein [Nocardiopsis salina]|uniref:hypothetical protein n=1 Tax=Nocardiopsis salina TaxID=245836 RepID=UPI0003452F86|nr:hypothetical protein [Nocardiopsis salina]